MCACQSRVFCIGNTACHSAQRSVSWLPCSSAGSRKACVSGCRSGASVGANVLMAGPGSSQLAELAGPAVGSCHSGRGKWLRPHLQQRGQQEGQRVQLLLQGSQAPQVALLAPRPSCPARPGTGPAPPSPRRTWALHVGDSRQRHSTCPRHGAQQIARGCCCGVASSTAPIVPSASWHRSAAATIAADSGAASWWAQSAAQHLPMYRRPAAHEQLGYMEWSTQGQELTDFP